MAKNVARRVSCKIFSMYLICNIIYYNKSQIKVTKTKDIFRQEHDWATFLPALLEHFWADEFVSGTSFWRAADVRRKPSD